MRSSNELRELLRSINHKSYPAYKALGGVWRFQKYILAIDHVQGDPFASPSHIHIELDLKSAGFPSGYCLNRPARIALQDYLTRTLGTQFERFNFRAKGSGKSGLLSISRCGQEVLERSACTITKDRLIVRFRVGFPAFGRSVNAEDMEKILFSFLPQCVENSLFYARLDGKKVEQAVFLAEDQASLRRQMKDKGIVSFVENGAVLPRKSGVSDLPMQGSVPFASPKTMEMTFVLPHRGAVTGMAVPAGITLIVGGGYHGKSTLLEAIQNGVYDHVAGDGREFVLTDETAVKLRAEDGRYVRNVDISLFIGDLPNKKDTTAFSSEDASGSTSQAAFLMESIEAGSHLLLIDEDTSATNFMVRDAFMQEVIRREKEPITPFLERALDLKEKAGVSTILVAGSSGAFFHIADHILMMDCYKPVDITERVKALCRERTAPRTKAPDFVLPEFDRVMPAYVRKEKGDRGHGRGAERRHEHMKVKAMGLESFSLDRETVNIRYLEQINDAEQTEALACLLRRGLEQTFDGRKTVRQSAEELMNALDKEDFSAISGSYIPCGLARPRIQDLYACINRFRG